MDRIESSLAWPDLAALLGECDAWVANRAEGPKGAEALAGRVVAHRSRLFEANARLQAESHGDDDPAMSAQVDANQDAIKRCTTALTDLSNALGRVSRP